MANWYDEALVLRDFAQALSDANVVDDTTDVFKKPYRYNDYYEVWKSAGSPGQEDSEWDNFVNALDDDEEEESDDAQSN